MGNMPLKIHWANYIVGRKFTSVACSKLLLNLALRTQIFLNFSHTSTLSIWTKEIQAKTEEWTTQTAIYCDTFWLQSFGTHNSSLANAKIYVLLDSFCFVLFWIWEQFPSIRKGDLSEGFLRVWGAYINWGAYFQNFTLFTSAKTSANKLLFILSLLWKGSNH